MDSRVGIDSHCVSYIIDTVEVVAKPTDALSQEKIALFRTYLYMKDTLYVTPTARMECDEIPDADRRATHRNFNNMIFGETFISDTKFVDERTNQLLKYHNGSDDCRIVAEAEDYRLDVLLTYDYTFLRNMRNVQISIRLCRPSEFWSTLNILPGAKPDKIPHPTNPLAEESWWVV